MRMTAHLWIILQAFIMAASMAPAEPPRFGERPRLEYTQAELDAWPADRVQACVAKAVWLQGHVSTFDN